MQAWISDLKAGGRWGHFILHDVVDNPGPYAISPTMLDRLAQLVAGSGVAVINYRQGYRTAANTTTASLVVPTMPTSVEAA